MILDFPGVTEAFEEFVQDRKERKEPMTTLAKKKAIKKLDLLAGGNARLAIAIIDEAIEKGWKGLYPLSPTALQLFRSQEMERKRLEKKPCEYCHKLIMESQRYSHECKQRVIEDPEKIDEAIKTLSKSWGVN